MKKLFLTLVIAFAGIFTANAQVWLGGSVNAMMNKDVKSFGVAPELGYSFAEVPLTIAVAADFDFYKDNLVKGSTLTLTPYVRFGWPLNTGQPLFQWVSWGTTTCIITRLSASISKLQPRV